MKLNLLALSTLLAVAAAQDTSSATTTSLSPQASCAENCGVNDRCCIAGCYEVPCPSDQQADDTNKCVAACPQGTGTPSDTEAYISCQNACFTSHFFPATMTGVTVPTGVVSATTTASDSTNTGSGSGSSASETGSSSSSETTGSSSSDSDSSESGSSTASGSGAAPTESDSGAPVKLGASAAGLLGLVLAAVAL